MARLPAGEGAVNPNTAIASDLLRRGAGDQPGDLQAIYDANRQPVDNLEVRVDGSSVSTLYMSELLLGHQDAAVDFYDSTVDRLASMPPETKPDVAVVSGFLQGAFNVVEKRRRKTLVPGLDNLDAQFKYARQKLEELQATGVPVVYNMSNDDHAIAEEMTVMSFRRMSHKPKATKRSTGARSTRCSAIRLG